jgi:hypothetical protein
MRPPRSNSQRSSPARQVIRPEEGDLIFIHAASWRCASHNAHVQRIAGKQHRNMLLRHILPEGISRFSTQGSPPESAGTACRYPAGEQTGNSPDRSGAAAQIIIKRQLLAESADAAG